MVFLSVTFELQSPPYSDYFMLNTIVASKCLKCLCYFPQLVLWMLVAASMEARMMDQAVVVIVLIQHFQMRHVQVKNKRYRFSSLFLDHCKYYLFYLSHSMCFCSAFLSGLMLFTTVLVFAFCRVVSEYEPCVKPSTLYQEKTNSH